jgi:putative transposase
VSFTADEPVQRLAVSGHSVGIDLGLKTFAVTSDGAEIHSPKPLSKYLRNLKKAQKALSRKKKGSANRAKAALSVVRIHNKVANIRRDFLHKCSTKIIRENQTVVVENLAVVNMVKNRSLAKSIYDMGWSEFVRQLKYKADWYGREFVQIGRFYPSSKLCSGCGHKLKELLLSTREWACPECGEVHDRDHNAAKNILAAGQSATQLVEAA